MSYNTTINGIKVKIVESNKSGKKLKAEFINPDTGFKNR